jgi:hypothetical protein
MQIDPNVLIGAAAKILAARMSKSQQQPEFTKRNDDIEASIGEHIKFVETWSSQIPFAGLPGSHSFNRVFTHLPLNVTPRRQRIQSVSNSEVTTQSLIESREHLVLLGDPGGGKTTVAKMLCQHLLHTEPTSSSDTCNYPLVLRCRELRIDDHPYLWLLDTIGVRISAKQENSREKLLMPSSLRELQKATVRFLNTNKICLIFDGLDETPRIIREEIVRVFQYLAHRVDEGRLVLTCRSGAFDFNIENADIFELSSLTPSKVDEFCERWIDDPQKRASFLVQLKESPFLDTTVRPLNLAHLCAIFEIYGRLPDRPKSVYRKIVFLLLEEWDRANLVSRDSEYSRFGPERKAEFLAAFAYAACINDFRGSFDEAEMIEMFTVIGKEFDLPVRDSRKVLSEIESHAGLIVQSGHRQYEFSHLSLQEYLCADYLVRGQLHSLSEDLISSLPNEIAVATSLSSNPNQTFASLVVKAKQSGEINQQFWQEYMSRLLMERPDFTNSELVGTATIYLVSMLKPSEQTSWLSFFLMHEPIYTSLEKLVRNRSVQIAKSTPRRAVADAESKIDGLIRAGSKSFVIDLPEIRTATGFIPRDEVTVHSKLLPSEISKLLDKRAKKIIKGEGF